MNATSPSLAQIAARYEAALPPGTLFSFPVTALDTALKTGAVPSWSVTLIPGSSSGGHGYGWDDAQAKVSALGELHETHGEELGKILQAAHSDFSEIVRELGEKGGVAALLDPASTSAFGACSTHDFDGNSHPNRHPSVGSGEPWAVFALVELVGRVGLEPTTQGL